MNKLKVVFYIMYALFFIFATFLAVFYEKMVLVWEWDWIDTWVGLMLFVLKLSGLGVVLFITNLVMERVHIKQLQREIKIQKEKISTLENKLNKS